MSARRRKPPPSTACPGCRSAELAPGQKMCQGCRLLERIGRGGQAVPCDCPAPAGGDGYGHRPACPLQVTP